LLLLLLLLLSRRTFVWCMLHGLAMRYLHGVRDMVQQQK
jgi:hypothetical protein